jgi:hypothetical protein
VLRPTLHALRYLRCMIRRSMSPPFRSYALTRAGASVKQSFVADSVSGKTRGPSIAEPDPCIVHPTRHFGRV